MNNWSMYIDIEGFSSIYLKDEYRAIWLLGKLMSDLYKVGSKLYKDEGNRLFVYQSGDGFVVTPDFEEETKRPISLAIALLRSMLARGGIAKAAISSGKMVDILGCYPEEIVKQSKDGVVNIGEGILVFNQVMGDALINAYKLINKAKGPLLVVTDDVIDKAGDCNLISYSENKYIFKPVSTVKDFTCYCINWIHYNPPLVNDILYSIGIDTLTLSENELKQELEKYLHNNTLNEEWVENAKKLIISG